MLKEVAPTEKIKSLVAKAYGDENLRFENIAVFEAVAANSQPLRRKYGIFAGARIMPDVMAGMVDWLAGGRSVPLQLMHMPGMPVGKVVGAELRQNNSLNALFYLSRETQADLIADINAGVISEISIGVTTQRILCSECGWDYLGADASFDNVYEGVCANGHKLGVDGVHTNLYGLADWMEVSLVDRGAVAGANILARPQQTFKFDERTGFDRTALRLFASASVDAPPKPEEGKEQMELQQQLIDTKVALGLAELARDANKTALEAAQASLAEAHAEIVSLKATQTPELSALEAELAIARPFVEELASSVFAATGKDATALPATLSERVTAIREARTTLSLIIPVGGAGKPAVNDADKQTAQNFSAFTGR